MPIIIATIIVLVAVIVVASLMEWKNEHDRKLYECYTKMIYKNMASGSGCVGEGMPQCEHCYYHKIYLRRGGL